MEKVNLELKDNPEVVETDDFWYDLLEDFDIRAQRHLTEESSKKVDDAIRVLKAFYKLLDENELIELY